MAATDECAHRACFRIADVTVMHSVTTRATGLTATVMARGATLAVASCSVEGASSSLLVLDMAAEAWGQEGVMRQGSAGCCERVVMGGDRRNYICDSYETRILDLRRSKRLARVGNSLVMYLRRYEHVEESW
jgi:hypothetical protein